MKKSLLPMMLGLMALSTIPASARILTPDQALERAGADSPMRAKAKSATTKLIYTALPDDSSDAGAYLFSTGNEGFIVVSADDIAPAVLGYSDAATVDPADMPPSFRYWLNQYAAQIEAARRYGVRKATQRHPQFEAIAPMVETHWNQNAPYNDMTPEVNGQHSVTGCVATALSQIMNYHQWPPKGQGSNSYEWNNQTISLDFSTVTFDWDNMLDNYTSSATAAQKQAVAQLMYACGVAVNMDYSPQESGAQTNILAEVMYKYFNYDKSVIVLNRDFYNLYDWETIVYDQLQNYGPVQYSGVSSEGGHSFVCDGYSSDGYFHINWGWGGMSDGYFLLTALDPETQGIGGSSSGYNSMQDIVANVSRPKSNTDFTPMMSMNTFAINTTTTAVGNSVTVTGFTYNGGIETIASGTLAMKAVPQSGGTPVYMGSTGMSQLKPQYGYNNWSFTIPATMAEGTYTISPVFKIGNGDWADVQVPISGSTYYIMTVQGSGIATIEAPQPVTVSVSDIDIEADIYAGVACHITATLTNEFENDFYGKIMPVLLSNEQLYAEATATMVNVPGEGSTSLDYMGKFTTAADGSAIATGQYTMVFCDAQTGDVISDPVAVTVNAKPATTTVSVTGLKVNDNNVVSDIDNVTFSGTFNVTSGAFGESFMVFIFPANGGQSLDYVFSSPIFASAGQSVPFSFKGALSAVNDKTKYMAAAFTGQTQISNGVTFTVDLSTGLSAVEATVEDGMYPNVTDGTTTFSGSTPCLIRVFSTTGALFAEVVDNPTVDLSSAAPGIYIIEITQQDNTRIINRVIRR